MHNVHVTLLNAFGDALEDQLLVRNPAIRAHPASSDRPLMRNWTAGQVRAFLHQVRDDGLLAP